MNLVVLLKDFYLSNSANTIIIKKLLYEIKNTFDIDITIVSQDKTIDKTENKFSFISIDMSEINYYSNIDSIRKKSPFKYFIHVLFNPSIIIHKIKNRISIDYLFVREYRKVISKMENKKNVLFLAVSSPYYTIQSFKNYKGKAKVFFYKLDPWSTNHQFIKNRNSFLIKETKIDHCATKIFIIKQLFSEYNNSILSKNLKKIIPIEYPILSMDFWNKINVSKISRTKIKFLYLGSFYEIIRSPQFLFSFFSFLGNDYLLETYGKFYGKEKSYYIEQYKNVSNIKINDSISQSQALQLINDFDVLVNVGNTIQNQLPSKIFEYINTGKPILNIVKNTNCPTISYLNRYPNCITMVEGYPIDQITVNSFLNFLKYKIDKIDYSIIETNFYDCTVSYISSVFINEISKLNIE
jgi:hypothetical protein